MLGSILHTNGVLLCDPEWHKWFKCLHAELTLSESCISRHHPFERGSLKTAGTGRGNRWSGTCQGSLSLSLSVMGQVHCSLRANDASDLMIFAGQLGARTAEPTPQRAWFSFDTSGC